MLFEFYGDYCRKFKKLSQKKNSSLGISKDCCFI